MLNITSFLPASTVAYLIATYAGIWALGYATGKAVAWVRVIKSVA